jgi:hypothetical protein
MSFQPGFEAERRAAELAAVALALWLVAPDTEAEFVTVAEDTEDVDVWENDVPDTRKPLPIVESVVQREDDGAGCAAGVLGSPWWNVELP